MLIAVTRPELVAGEWRQIERYLDNGFARVHIRKPEWSEAATEELLQRISCRLYSRLTLHDHHRLALKYGCGVQCNARNPKPAKDSSLISRSCHSLKEAAACKEYDYVTISPIFDSISKPGYKANTSLIDDVRRADLTSYPPLVAMGGVTFENIEILKNYGFAGAAMLGTLWQ